jgi:hypothetical protein
VRDHHDVYTFVLVASPIVAVLFLHVVAHHTVRSKRAGASEPAVAIDATSTYIISVPRCTGDHVLLPRGRCAVRPKW